MTSKNQHKITIIGGGVNGVCSAYYLHKAGFEVEIVDPSFSGDGTSYGNAGMIVPSHFIPMASPGIISKGMKWMFDASSPFYIKPRLNLSLAQWLWRFTRSCNAQNVNRAQELIWNYNELSRDEYEVISKEERFDFDFKQHGLLMLYKSQKSKKEEIEIAEKGKALGLKVKILDQQGVQKLNPHTKTDVLGGVYYPDDAHLYSNRFMTQMIDHLKANKVQFVKKKVVDFQLTNHRVHKMIFKDGSKAQVNELVLAAGAWTGILARKLGIHILLEDGKGYSITKKNIDLKPTIPSILTDEKVAITPMGSDLRITGTLEISGRSTKINQKRVDGFLAAVPKYFPEMDTKTYANDEVWTGYRPLSFDGVPYLGRSAKVKNVILATGHGMMGMSLGPATGKLVAELMTESKTSLNLQLMRLDR